MRTTKIKYFEDFEVGAERSTDQYYEVTRDNIVAMARAWDPQPFHIDENAPETKEFGGLIACSAHTFAIFCHLGSHDPVKVAAIAAMGFEEMRMLLPLRPGDRIRAASTCLYKRESRSKPDRGIIEAQTILRNQDDQDVFSVKSTTLVRKRPPSGA